MTNPTRELRASTPVTVRVEGLEPLSRLPTAGHVRIADRHRIRPPVRGWAIWTLPRRGIATLLVLECAALALAVLVAVQSTIRVHDVTIMVALCLLSVVTNEATDRIEGLRRVLMAERGVWSGHNSVACFAGLLSLSTPAALLQVLVMYAHTVYRYKRHNAGPLYRQVWTGASVVYGTVAAAGLFHAMGGEFSDVDLRDTGVLLLTMAIYTVVGLIVLLVGVRAVLGPVQVRQLLPKRPEVLNEQATLALGIVTAILIRHAIYLAPVTFAMAGVLHRASLVGALQKAATVDAKTGLLNAATWAERAQAELARCSRAVTSAALLIVDIDHFKAVNDQYGHLTGDVVLSVMGQTLRREMREIDIVGRFGGEEFAALLPDTTLPLAVAAAERIRRKVAETPLAGGVRITASIGVASSDLAPDLTELLAHADRALYRAKAAGRNRVDHACLD